MNFKIKPTKVLFFLTGIAICVSIYAQDNVPSGLRYQAIARDDKGNPLIQRDIIAKMQIVQMDKDLLIWEELHYTSTNQFGLFQLTIGEGFTTGEGLVLDFENINWGEGSIAVHVDVDFGKGFLDMGSAMLQSVPYAFLADSALKAPLPNIELGQLEDVSDQNPTKNQPLLWNGKEWLPGDSLKIKNLLIQDALKIGDSGLIIGITSDSNLSDASDQTIPTSEAVKSYVDNADPFNEIQDLHLLDTNTLIITGISNPTKINLAPFRGENTDNQELSLSGTLLDISGGNDVDLSLIQDGTEDADSDPLNELQDISLAGTNLSISNGSIIDLSNINTDDQSLILNDHLLTIEDGNSITLPDNVNDNDSDPSNELQDISLSNTFLSISNGSTIDLTPVQDGYEPNTDNQNLSITGHQLSIEDGNSINLPDDVNDADADPANEIQDISLSSTFLSITDGSTIDLSPVRDGYEPNTDDQTLLLNDHELTIEGGNTITLPDNVDDADSDASNELQELLISGNIISISNGNSIELPGGTVDEDADPTNEIQDLQLESNILTITNNSNATPISLAPYSGENTDNQNLSLSGTLLSITGGTGVDLSSLPDEVNDADADPGNEIQDISLIGTNLSISNGSTVDLGVVQDGYDPDTDDQNLGITGHLLTIENGNTVTLPDNVNDADANPSNELQDISLASTFLSISNGSTIDLSLIQDGYEPNTDDQNLILNGHLLTIEGGNTITLPDNVDDADANPFNELQDISLTGTNLSITNGSTIDLGGIDTDTRLTEPEVDAYVANNGYLTTESDPIFSASPAGSITSPNITNWNTAFGWGDHAAAGYLTGFTETDPIFTAHTASSITVLNITNWNTAHGWGNHAAVGYLTSESDPIFSASPAASITMTDLGNWDLAYSWGDHAAAGYLTSATAETDPIFAAHVASSITALNITNWNTAYGWGNHAWAGYLISESDPIFSASPAASITSLNITNWNSAHGWGNHAAVGYLTSESDPIFSASPAASITMTDLGNWDLAYSWGDHAAAGYLTWFTETDPIFSASPAAGITIPDINNWNSYVNYWNITGSDIYVLGRHVGIGTSSPAASLHVANNDVVFTAPYTLPGTPGAPPVTGQGARMMWYPDKAAFRAGTVAGTNWDLSSVGINSVAFGHDSRAAGGYSTASGAFTEANGYGSVALGHSSRAEHYYTTASGRTAIAEGYASVAMGYYITAQAYNSTVIGRYNVVSGNPDTPVDTDPIFIVGNGTSTIDRNNALTVYRNGNMEVDGDVTAVRFFGDGSGLTGVGGVQCLSWNNSTRQLSIDGCAGTVYISDYWEADTDNQTLDNAYSYGRIINTDYGDVSIRGSNGLEVYNDINLGLNIATDNDRINFDYSTTIEYLEWNNSNAAFMFSDDIQLSTGSVFRNSTSSLPYNSLTISGTSSPLSGRMDNAGDLFIQDDLEVRDDLYIQDLFVNGTVSGININDADSNPTNELQVLGFSGTTLSLSPSGGSVTLPWANNGSTYGYSYRNIGINTTTPGNDFVIYDATGYVEMDHNSISVFGEGVEKIQASTQDGYPGWIGTRGPGGSVNAVIGYVTGSEDFGSISVLNDGSNFRAGMQVNSNGAGSLSAEGPNDEYNFRATYYWTGYENHGWASVHDAAGDARAAMYVNPSGVGVMEANIINAIDISATTITATTKNFRIPHPDMPGYEIVYACIEGPEAAAYVRGTAELTNGMVDIIFPDHFQHVATEASMTIMLTPLSADSRGLAVVAKSTSGFTVRELSSGTGTYAFDWEAKCIRKGHEDYKVIQESTDIVAKKSTLQGGGPDDNRAPAPKDR